MAAQLPQMETTLPREFEGNPESNPEQLTTATLKVWQELALVVCKTMIVYCGMSLGILCVLAWLILSGSLALEPPEEETLIAPFNATPLGTIILPNKLHSRPHLHDTEFYMFILTLLVSTRAVLLYMAKALKRPVLQKNSSSVGTWLFGALCIVIGEFILGLSLLQCLPGAHILILIFLFVEIIVQAAFMWIVWNFKLEVMMAASSS